MINSRKKTALALCGIVAVAVAIAGCSSKGAETAPTAGDGDVATGAGITGTTINLGVVVDLTGPFAVLSTDHNRGVQLYWDQKNADGGVCGTYDVNLEIKDHAYNVQNAVTVYQEIAGDVLAFQDFVGGSHTAAILGDAVADERVILPSSATQQLADSPVIMLTSALYDTDMEIVLEWMIEDGLIAEGDTVANVYVEGDYGEASHQGVVAGADANGLTVLPYMVKATDTDMTAPLTDAIAKGASAVFASTTPGQTASIATVLQTSGADIPIGGSWPSYAPGLLDTPAADYLVDHFVAAAYTTTFETETGAALYGELTARFPGETITNQATIGYGSAYVLDQVLEAACAAGDLTPAGVLAAREDIGVVDSEGLMPPLDYTKIGTSPTLEGYIIRFDPSVDGGLTTVSDGLFGLD